MSRKATRCRSGDVVAEIETDKATMEVEAAEDGMIGKLLRGRRHRARAGQPPDRALADRGRRTKRRCVSPSPQRGEARRCGARLRVRGPRRELTLRTPRPSASSPQGRERSRTASSDGASRRVGKEARRAVMIRSPNDRQRSREPHLRLALARRLAREFGLELAALNGSGPHGRIVKADVERAARETVRPEPSRRR